MLTSSVTVFTLDVSKEPCVSVPRPLVPGVPAWGAPLAADSTKRLLPCGCRPSSLMKSASCTCPIEVVLLVADTAVTTPSLPTVTDWVPAGIVIAGGGGEPLGGQ